jgi:hypothetical protein
VNDSMSQAEEMIRSWADVQQKMWSRWQELWLEGLRGAGEASRSGSPDSPAEQARRVLEAWDQSVKRALEAQLEWTRIWSERFAESSDVPPHVINAARQLNEAAKAWTGLQTRLWESWLGAAGGPASSGVETFQETARKLAEAQTEWFRQWSGMAKDEPSKGSRRGGRQGPAG